MSSRTGPPGKRVAVLQDGEVVVHCDGSGFNDYDTLCGIDANDQAIGHMPAVAHPSRRIDCAACLAIYRVAKTYRLQDFADDGRLP